MDERQRVGSATRSGTSRCRVQPATASPNSPRHRPRCTRDGEQRLVVNGRTRLRGARYREWDAIGHPAGAQWAAHEAMSLHRCIRRMMEALP